MRHSRFVPACVLAIFTSLLVAAAVQAAETVRFPASTPWSGKALELRGELFGASDGQRPAIVLLHGCGGLQPAVRKSLIAHASYLASRGYAALILDSFGPRGLTGGRACGSNSMLQAAIRYRAADARDAARYLRSRKDIDARNLFVMGQSNGGSVALALARSGQASGYRAAVAYYPWCSGPGGYSLPVLILSGDADDWTPASSCQRQIGGTTNVVVYPDVVHSFDVPVEAQLFYGHRIGYSASATADSRRRMASFLASNLVR